MQNLDNHMDELFKKAAESYPLKTNTGNFDDLLPLIGIETATTTVKPALSNGKRKISLLIVGFLIMGGTTYLITNSSNDKTIKTKASVKEKSITPIYNNTSPEKNMNVGSKAPIENTLPSLVTIYQKNKLTLYTKGSMLTNIISPVAEANEDLKKITDQTDNVKPIDNTEPGKIINQQQANNIIVAKEDKKEHIDNINKQKDLTSNETKTEEKKDNKNRSINKPVFYYGIAAGAEFNEVKNQAMTKAGINGAVMLGLQISSKTAIETGVQLSQKKYYSDGKYFKPKAGSMPANMSINSLQSTSTIIEIPVSVKYNFSKKKNTLYSKAGLSTYILTNESNKYKAVVSGQQQEINSTYKNNHSYFASDLRISAGYQHAVAKKLNIRVEPYIQIPLKGIGVGNMPVTTTGLQLVLTGN